MRRADLLAVSAIAAGAVLTVWFAPGAGPLRLVFGLSLVLFVPGYAITAALFPASLQWADRLVLSVTLSLATSVLGGLLIHVVRGTLDARTWAALLANVTVWAALAAFWRGRRSHPSAFSLPCLSRLQAAALAAAALLVVGAVVLARTPLPASGVAGYTNLWLVPTANSELELGVHSVEQSATRYRVEVRVDGRLARRWQVRLVPGSTWETRLRRPGPGALEVQLFRGANHRVYRRVALHRG
jgi:uncharacterized membrane protein